MRRGHIAVLHDACGSAGKEHRPVSRSEDPKDILEISQTRDTGRESKREISGMGDKVDSDKSNKFDG